MAAIYYDIGNDRNIFRSNIKAPEVVQIDFLNNLITNEYRDAMLVLNSVEAVSNETVQFFMTFDDVVDYFYFGKGIGQLVISGSIFTSVDSACGETMQGIQKLYSAIGAARGQKVKVSFAGGPAFTGVITNFRGGLTADPMIVLEFSINIAVIDQHGFEPVKTQVTTC